MNATSNIGRILPTHLCVCGEPKDRRARSCRSCYQKLHPPAHNRIDLTGQVFGRLTVARYMSTNRRRKAVWETVCECGITVRVSGDDLKSGHTSSCGCLRQWEHPTHSISYRTWHAMMKRCHDTGSEKFKFYGGRGISVCERWRDYDNFVSDMGDRPVGSTLDRIDNDGNYEPGNCRWATQRQQMNNTRSNRHITVSGETHTYREWERIKCLSRGVLWARINLGWTPEMAVTGRQS